MDETDKFLTNILKWYLLERFFVGGLVLLAGIIGGNCFVVYWIYKEISLELSYKQKYGADWQIEFEKYHGSLSHAHTQLIICVTGILAIVAVLIWSCRQMFHKHKYHKHKYGKV